MKVKEESEKVGLKFNIQKTKIKASGPITSWQINGEIMETVFTRSHVHRVNDTILPSHPLSSPSPPAPNPS